MDTCVQPELNFRHKFYDDGRGTSYLGKTMDKLRSLESTVENDNYSFLDAAATAFSSDMKRCLAGFITSIFYNDKLCIQAAIEISLKQIPIAPVCTSPVKKTPPMV